MRRLKDYRVVFFFLNVSALALLSPGLLRKGVLPVAAVAPDLELVDHVVGSQVSSFRQWSRGGLWLHGYKKSQYSQSITELIPS